MTTIAIKRDASITGEVNYKIAIAMVTISLLAFVVMTMDITRRICALM